MRLISILFISIILTACASTGSEQPVVTDYDSDGVVQRQTVMLNGSQYMDSQIAKSKTECQKAYYGAYQNTSDKSDLIIARAIDALSNHDPCKTITTNNDVRIVKTQERHKSLRKGLGIIVPVAGIWAAKETAETLATTRDPVIVNPPEPIIVEPFIVTPEIVVLP